MKRKNRWQVIGSGAIGLSLIGAGFLGTLERAESDRLLNPDSDHETSSITLPEGQRFEGEPILSETSALLDTAALPILEAPDLLKRFPEADFINARAWWQSPAQSIAYEALYRTDFQSPYIIVHTDYSPEGKVVGAPVAWVANHLLVKVKAGVSGAFFENALPEELSLLEPVDPVSGLCLVGWEEPGVEAHAEYLSRLNQMSDLVEYAEPDGLVFTMLSPNDPEFGSSDQSWGLQTAAVGGVDIDINGPEGWDTRRSAGSQVVAIIDSGARLSHQDLSGNLWRNAQEIAGNGLDDDFNGLIDDVNGYDYVHNDSDPSDDGAVGHGSHVAGILGAEGNNGVGITGVVWSGQLMILKALDSNGVGTTNNLQKAVRYAGAKGASVINASWGASFNSTSLRNAISDVGQNNDVLLIAAAGNEGSDLATEMFYPAAYDLDNIVTIGALNQAGERFSSSNYSATLVDLFAPGENIYSISNESDTSYRDLSGTSMATAYVSGIAVLLRAQYPSDDYTEIAQRLFLTSLGHEPLVGLCRYAGIPKLDRALGGVSRETVAITGFTAGAVVYTGGEFTFSVSVSGEGPFEYTWFLNGNPLPGETGASLLFDDLETADNGNYHVAVTNLTGMTTSNSSPLTVLRSVPIFMSQPESINAQPADWVTFEAEVTGSVPLQFQWEHNGSAISGATAATLTLTQVTAADAGTYQLVATNSVGITRSSEVTLTVADQGTAQLPVFAGDTRANAVGWYYNSWLGYYWSVNNSQAEGWKFHFGLGYVFVGSNPSAESLWLWDLELGWLWTAEEHWPYLYRYDDSTWYYYLEESRDPRWFYNSSTRQWQN